MKERVGSVCVALALALLALAPATHADVKTPSADERALLKLEDDWVAAESRRDVAALRAILHDKFMCTWGDAAPIGKEAFIKAVTSDPTIGQEISDRSFTVDGDTAVIAETDTVRRRKGGARSVSTDRFTVTYIKRGDRWLALGEQSTPIHKRDFFHSAMALGSQTYQRLRDAVQHGLQGIFVHPLQKAKAEVRPIRRGALRSST